jgi:hypothetical protein
VPQAATILEDERDGGARSPEVVLTHASIRVTEVSPYHGVVMKAAQHARGQERNGYAKERPL